MLKSMRLVSLKSNKLANNLEHVNANRIIKQLQAYNILTLLHKFMVYKEQKFSSKFNKPMAW